MFLDREDHDSAERERKHQQSKVGRKFVDIRSAHSVDTVGDCAASGLDRFIETGLFRPSQVNEKNELKDLGRTYLARVKAVGHFAVRKSRAVAKKRYVRSLVKLPIVQYIRPCTNESLM